MEKEYSLKQFFFADSQEKTFIIYYSLIITTLYISFGTAHLFTKFLSDVNLWDAYFFQYGFVLLFFFLVPFIVMIFKFKKTPADLGLSIGNFRFNIKLLAVLIPAAIPVLFFSSTQHDFLKEYPLIHSAFLNFKTIILWELLYLVYYIGWEFFFRGFLLRGLMQKNSLFFAIAYQTALSTILHIGKPSGEIIAALVAGFAFAWWTIKGKSIIPLIVFHFVVGMLTDLFTAFHGGFLLK